MDIERKLQLVVGGEEVELCVSRACIEKVSNILKVESSVLTDDQLKEFLAKSMKDALEKEGI